MILTANEVQHVREYPYTALFILSNIDIERADDGTATAAGGDWQTLLASSSRRERAPSGYR